jgi:hypothetical protein
VVPPFNVIVLGITVHVINGEEEEQPSCTVPVTPVPPEICNPKKAVPPGVVVAVVVPPDGTVTTTPVGELNVAVTAVAAVIVTVQVPVPSHGALQPVNVDPVAGVAVNVTWVPLAKLAEQVGMQLMPAGVLVTVPVPLPASVTVSAKFVVPPPKFAVTVVAAVIVTVHVPVPSHGALHPVNVEPVAGFAVNVTCVPLTKFALHVGLQLIPAGALATVPVPVPASVTVNAKFVVPPPNVAVTDVAAVIVKVQVPVPSQLFAPLHPVNVDPVAGAAVNVTTVPLAKFAEHVGMQLIPEGTLVTVPVPVPVSVTASATCEDVLKVAVTVTSDVTIGTIHVGGVVCGFAGTQFALKLASVEPAAGVAVIVMLLLSGNGATHTAGQLRPGGVETTCPAPEPPTVIVRLLFPAVFSPNIANPDAKAVGETNVETWVPLAISNLKMLPVSRSAVQNETPSGSRLSANKLLTAVEGVYVARMAPAALSRIATVESATRTVPSGS